MSTLVIDGTCSVLASGGGTSAALSNLTTSGPGVVVVCIQTNSDPPNAVTVTDSAGLNWVLAAQDSQQGLHIHAFEAKSVAALTNDVITVHVAGSGSGFIVASGSGWRGGLDLNAPFDPGVSPVVTTSDPVNGSTTVRSTVALAAFRTGEFTPTAGSGWTGIYNNQFGSFFVTEYKRFTSVQASVSATLTTGAGTGNGSILLILAESPISGAIATSSVHGPKAGVGKTPTGVVATTTAGATTLRVTSNVGVAGAAATAAAGAVVPANFRIVDGRFLTTAPGQVSFQATLIGAGMTADTGDVVVAVSIDKAVTGAAATTAAGTVSNMVTTNVSVAGATGLSAPGAVATIVSPELVGASMTAEAGVVSNFGANIVGAVATTAAGTVSPNVAAQSEGAITPTTYGTVSVTAPGDIAILGAAATTAAGTIVSTQSDVTYPQVGAAMTALTGGPDFTIEFEIAGASASANPGSLSTGPAELFTVGGASASITPGVPVSATSAVVAGIAAAGAAGLVAPLAAAQPAGAALTAAPGVAQGAVARTAVGASTAAAAGAVAFASDGTATATGTTATASVSAVAVSASSNIVVIGVSAATAHGTIASGAAATVVSSTAVVAANPPVPLVSVDVIGVIASVSAGVVAGSVTISGVSTTLATGAVVPFVQPLVAGAAATMQAGEVVAGAITVVHPSGASVASAAGIVGGTLTVELTGGQATVSAGLATFGMLVEAHGVSAIVVSGDVGGFQSSSNVAVTGVICIAAAGAVNPRNIVRIPKGASLLPFGRGAATLDRRRRI